MASIQHSAAWLTALRFWTAGPVAVCIRLWTGLFILLIRVKYSLLLQITVSKVICSSSRLSIFKSTMEYLLLKHAYSKRGCISPKCFASSGSWSLCCSVSACALPGRGAHVLPSTEAPWCPSPPSAVTPPVRNCFVHSEGARLWARSAPITSSLSKNSFGLPSSYRDGLCSRGIRPCQQPLGRGSLRAPRGSLGWSPHAKSNPAGHQSRLPMALWCRPSVLTKHSVKFLTPAAAVRLPQGWFVSSSYSVSEWYIYIYPADKGSWNFSWKIIQVYA